MTKLGTLLIALQLIDAVTTYIALRNPALLESNPVLLWLMERVGLVPALVAAKGLFIVLVIWGAPHTPDAVLAGLCVFYGWVVLNNASLIRSNKSPE